MIVRGLLGRFPRVDAVPTTERASAPPLVCDGKSVLRLISRRTRPGEVLHPSSGRKHQACSYSPACLSRPVGLPHPPPAALLVASVDASSHWPSSKLEERKGQFGVAGCISHAIHPAAPQKQGARGVCNYLSPTRKTERSCVERRYRPRSIPPKKK